MKANFKWNLFYLGGFCHRPNCPFWLSHFLLTSIVLVVEMAASAEEMSLASQATVTIHGQPFPLYPATLPTMPNLPSPGTNEQGGEYLLVRTAAGAPALVLVTVTNGPLELRYGQERIGKGEQLKVNGHDFPILAATGLHATTELERTRTITGKRVEEINRSGRPGQASGTGFLAEDEDVLSVLKGDNELVKTLGLRHPDLARPLFQIWNLLLREYELGKFGRFKEDIVGVWYRGREIGLRTQRTKGFQESIFNDEIKGAFDIELWRELDPDERKCLDKAYAHLSVSDREAMIGRLIRLRTGEMVPYYIMRYGFYEGHTAYRVDPIALATLFGLKPLPEIDRDFQGKLDRVLTAHFK